MPRRVVRNPKDDVKARDDVRRNARGGLGTEIAALFKGAGLRGGEEIEELRGHFIFDDC